MPPRSPPGIAGPSSPISARSRKARTPERTRSLRRNSRRLRTRPHDDPAFRKVPGPPGNRPVRLSGGRRPPACGQSGGGSLPSRLLLPGIPRQLPVLAGSGARVDGDSHGASSSRGILGLYHAANPGSGHRNAAAPGALLRPPALRASHPDPLGGSFRTGGEPGIPASRGVHESRRGHRPRRHLFPLLGRIGPGPLPRIGPARPDWGSARAAPAPASEWRGSPPLRGHDVLRRGRLDARHGTPGKLHDRGADRRRRPGRLGIRPRDRRPGAPLPDASPLGGGDSRTPPGSGQLASDRGPPVGIRVLLAVPHHLVGKPAPGGRLVCPSNLPGLEGISPDAPRAPSGGSARAAPLSRREGAPGRPGVAGGDAPGASSPGGILADPPRLRTRGPRLPLDDPGGGPGDGGTVDGVVSSASE